MGWRQAVGLAAALRERAIDCLRRAPVPTHPQQAGRREIALESYKSALAFNPLLHGKWYRPMTQDRLDETDSPVLLTEFDYAAIVLNSGRLLSDGVTHVSVFDGMNLIQEDYSTHHRLKPASTLKRKPVRKIPGTTLHLCSPMATVRGNYAHWLLDGLARWVLLEDRASESIPVDQFLIPANKSALRESLHVLGVSDERIVEMPVHQALEFEQLVCVARPRGYSSNVAPGWLLEGYRERLKEFMAPPSQANRRLYISRRDAGARKFRQEDELVSELEQRGFQSVELSKLGLKEKADLFSQASVVIGLTGAGMTSVMFCPADTKVVEIYPSNFVSYLFATICYASGHQHHPYIFQNTSKKSLLSRHSGEFDLDTADFLSSLDAWLNPAS